MAILVCAPTKPIFTIALRIMTEIWSGRLLSLENNYITWLTTYAAGSGILFAIISQSLSKGNDESFMSKALRFTRRRAKDD